MCVDQDNARHSEAPEGGNPENDTTESPGGDTGGLGFASEGQPRDGDVGEGNPLKIAIVGTAPGWEDAPFDDPSWTVWSLSRSYTLIPRWDAWFELHKLEDVCKTWEPGNEAAESAARATYLAWLQQQECPVFVREPRDELPNAQPYPLQLVLHRFPRAYFTNTISYMMALAIMSDPEAIGLWGVDMELSSEYGHQRPSCEYFIGIADGAGIDMIVPERSDLCKARKLYAFEDDRGFMAKMVAKRQHLEGIRQRLDMEQRQAELNKAGMDGAIEMLKLVTESWES